MDQCHTYFYTASDDNSRGGGGPLLMNGRTSMLLRIITSLLLPCIMEQSATTNSTTESNERSINEDKLKSRLLSLLAFIHELMINDDDGNEINIGCPMKQRWKYCMW